MLASVAAFLLLGNTDCVEPLILPLHFEIAVGVVTSLATEWQVVVSFHLTDGSLAEISAFSVEDTATGAARNVDILDRCDSYRYRSSRNRLVLVDTPIGFCHRTGQYGTGPGIRSGQAGGNAQLAGQLSVGRSAGP